MAQTVWATPWPKSTWATLGHLTLGHPETRMESQSCWPKPSWATVDHQWPGPHTSLGVGQWATQAGTGEPPEQKESRTPSLERVCMTDGLDADESHQDDAQAKRWAHLVLLLAEPDAELNRATLSLVRWPAVVRRHRLADDHDEPESRRVARLARADAGKGAGKRQRGSGGAAIERTGVDSGQGVGVV